MRYVPFFGLEKYIVKYHNSAFNWLQQKQSYLIVQGSEVAL